MFGRSLPDAVVYVVLVGMPTGLILRGVVQTVRERVRWRAVERLTATHGTKALSAMPELVRAVREDEYPRKRSRIRRPPDRAT